MNAVFAGFGVAGCKPYICRSMQNKMKYSGFIIRRTELSDLDEVMAVYEVARKSMREAGNPGQWVNGYPSRQLILSDIEAGHSYVLEVSELDRRIAGVFTFIIGEDPTYAHIEGRWPDNAPYGTIHRIASAGIVKGVADACLDFCRRQGISIRIDTHERNTPMLNWIAKRGFTYCGIIHVADGTPRRAFQLAR